MYRNQKIRGLLSEGFLKISSTVEGLNCNYKFPLEKMSTGKPGLISYTVDKMSCNYIKKQKENFQN